MIFISSYKIQAILLHQFFWIYVKANWTRSHLDSCISRNSLFVWNFETNHLNRLLKFNIFNAYIQSMIRSNLNIAQLDMNLPSELFQHMHVRTTWFDPDTPGRRSSSSTLFSAVRCFCTTSNGGHSGSHASQVHARTIAVLATQIAVQIQAQMQRSSPIQTNQVKTFRIFYYFHRFFKLKN